MASNELIIVDPLILFQKVLINSMKNNELYGMNLFLVEMCNKTVKKLKSELKGLAYPNIYLGINH